MENSNLANVWQSFLDEMDKQIGKDAAEMWIRPVAAMSIEGNILKLEVPNPVFLDILKSRYEENIISFFSKHTGEAVLIEYSVSQKEAEKAYISVSGTQNSAKPPFPSRLNPHYTFDTFIEGPSNKFAYRAAQATASKLGDRTNNPLVIFSAPGMGKTHILHSIGHEIIAKNPQAKVLYISGEEFVNEYIESLSKKTAEPFRNKYRNLDCFLIDDIQFVAGKDRSEQELFYTFNSLFESKRQIVITSDRTPQELSLNERLSSRLLSGIVAQIQQPDIETRTAILRAKRDAGKFNIPDDLLSFLAEHIATSVRELEGSLIRLHSYCEIQGIQPSADIAKELLADVFSYGDASFAVSIEDIKKVVAKHYKIDMEDFSSQKRTHSITWPRQIAMYLANEMTQMSLPEIGRVFNRDHSTVVHARDQVKEEIGKDPFFSAEINHIIMDIKSVDKS